MGNYRQHEFIGIRQLVDWLLIGFVIRITFDLLLVGHNSLDNVHVFNAQRTNIEAGIRKKKQEISQLVVEVNK